MRTNCLLGWISCALVLAGCGRAPAADRPALDAGVHLGALLDPHSMAHLDEVLAQPARVQRREGGGLVVTREPDGVLDVAGAELRIAPVALDGVEVWFGDRAPIRVREEGALDAARVEGASVSYAREGGRSYWTVATEHARGFEEWLAIGGGRAYRDRVLARWQVDAPLRQVSETGGVHVLGEDGEPVAYVSAPRAWAASGETVAARLTIEDGAIVLRVDAEGAPVLVDPMWVPTGSMSITRRDFYQGYGMVPVPGGALIVGGFHDATSSVLASAERYSSVTAVWSGAGAMSTPRRRFTTTLLADGRVLVTGGDTGAGPTATAEIYDPTSGTWTATGSMTATRVFHAAALLPSGRVLVAGGAGASGTTASAEIYDPTTGAWSPTAAMSTPRLMATATTFSSGRVLVAGGVNLASAEIYDPTSSTWSSAGSMSQVRSRHTATLLASGRVLVTGGIDTATVGGAFASADLYDPTTGAWSATGLMTAGRYTHSATVLPSGRVLIAGGYGGGTVLASTELYDPALGTFSSTGAMPVARSVHTATQLATGRALVAGGFPATASAHLFVDDPVCGNAFVEAGETCDDGNTIPGDCCSSACQLEPATTVCRAPAGPCDSAETCTGSSPACPADARAPSGTSCRPVAGPCDVAETCDGTSVSCPADGLAPSTTTCRTATGACDIAETCSGTSASCPVDAFAPSTTTCRPASGGCDVAESCTGSSGSCPADALAPATTVCRDAVGACDVPELCTGGDPACPSDAAQPEGTACGAAPLGACDAADACSGAIGATATCVALFVAAGTECRAASCTAGTETPAASCTGGDVECPLAVSSACSPYVCGATACTTACAADAECAGGHFCDGGACVAVLGNGAACARGGQCGSGLCVDGVCCGGACAGQCEACDVAGAEGTCVAVSGDPHGARAACDGEGTVCGGQCDGMVRDACTYPDGSTSCGMASCVGAVATAEARCDGAGACTPGAVTECAPYACGAEACLTSCTRPADCAAGLECVAGACVAAAGDAGAPGDGGTGDDAGTGQDAGARDASTPIDAFTVDDSGTGAPGSTSGCGCSAPGETRHGGSAALFAIIPLVWIVAARRRR